MMHRETRGRAVRLISAGWARLRGPLAAIPILFTAPVAADAGVLFSGHVADINGNPLAQALVTLTPAAGHAGADAISVFSDDDGKFALPDSIIVTSDALPAVSARVLGYEQVQATSSVDRDAEGNQTAHLTVVMRATPNQADVAPSSAWLASMPAEKRAQLILACASCHQVPAPEVRAYAAAIDDIDTPDPVKARELSWHSIVKYMNLMWLEEVRRGIPGAPPLDTHGAYSIGNGEEISAILSEYFVGRMQDLPGYQYGAPLAVTPATTIREYQVDRPNAIREALLLGDPPRLWIADVSTDRIIAADVATGEQQVFDIPAEVDVGPHTLHPGPDRSLWVAPFFNGVVAHLDIDEETWRVWQLKTKDGKTAGIHDLSFGPNHELLTDKKGRVWFSDIVNNGVGYFHPDSGQIEIFGAPEIAGRPGSGALLYGLAMTDDQKYIWYSQLGIGSFGCFNVETEEFETIVQLPMVDAGPRRITMGDDDVLYVPLYGAGQLVAYDTGNRKQIGIYDLPDRGSAPYAVTWDPVRKVVWIPTSNADVIYRFDPETKDFGVIPLPRQRGFLRMIDVDPQTGVLVTSYANILEQVQGPRMALIVDPGDGAYQSGLASQ
jgi:streptogramin lyase